MSIRNYILQFVCFFKQDTKNVLHVLKKTRWRNMNIGEKIISIMFIMNIILGNMMIIATEIPSLQLNIENSTNIFFIFLKFSVFIEVLLASMFYIIYYMTACFMIFAIYLISCLPVFIFTLIRRKERIKTMLNIIILSICTIVFCIVITNIDDYLARLIPLNYDSLLSHIGVIRIAICSGILLPLNPFTLYRILKTYNQEKN